MDKQGTDRRRNAVGNAAIKCFFPAVMALICCSASFASGHERCVPEKLQCEYLVNPLGVDNPNPRLSWRLQDTRQGAKQTAYRVYVGTDSAAVANGQADAWNPGKIRSQETLITYRGAELKPFTRYYWKVSVWDKEEVEAGSSVHAFETGMMGMENWQGAWIGDGNDIHYKPAPYFRKTFDTRKTIRSARAYIAVAGLYELYINGEKIGNHRLDPVYTRFDRRNLYVTHDVTSSLKNGKNAVGVLLGNGWYNHQSFAVWDFDRAPWRNRPAFCMDLRITYSDGSVEVITSDLDWKTSSGPVVLNSIYTAEHYDARLEQKGWNTASFDDSGWKRVRYRSAPSARITSQQLHPIRNVKTIPAIELKKLDETAWLYDFGQNMSGVTRLKLAGEEGTVVRLKHGERLHPDGHVDLSNIDVYYRPKDDTDPFQTDIVILSGKGEDTFMPKFNYKGFRYVEVITDKPMELTKDNLTAYFMHSDVPPVGEITTSSELVNKLCRATNNAYLSNLMGYPTDCPQREKNGWTGDGHLAIETALYNFDAITIYEKWLADHRDEQQPNGVLPDIIPTGGWGYGTHNGLDWTSTIAIIPWNIYLFYGDSKLLADCYENIKRYVDYVSRIAPDGLTSWGRGDWVPVKSKSNLELTSSVYYFTDATILANAAKLFDKQDDYRYYSALARKIKDAVNNKYLDKEKGIYASGTQTELSVPLMWGVVPDEYKAKVVRNLAKKVEEAGFHLDVGVLGAKAILNALSENGYAETAYKVAAQDTYPSWGWWIVNGATTLLENWDLKAERDISDNHMMFGEIGGWFFKGLGGIKPDPEQPGFRHILLRPNFVSGLSNFKATFDSPSGPIVSQWVRKGKKITYTVEIPPNSSATLYIPDYIKVKGDRTIKLEAGKHTFDLSETDPNQQKEIFLSDTVFAKAIEPETGAANLERLRANYASKEDFEQRKASIRKAMFYQLGLEPMPKRESLNPIVTGKQVRDGYTIENIALEILPGVWTYGNLYRPTNAEEKHPAVMLAHGHSPLVKGEFRGRFMPVRQTIAASLAKMGALVFCFDMFGYGESGLQVGLNAHKTGLAQTINVLGCLSVLDYLTSLPDVDNTRIGMTGESGGGTQTFFTTALDDRITVSAPVVQVSCFFPGGCTCESGRPIHIGVEPHTNNVEIAAMAVPRPLLIVSDGGDWTRTVNKVEFPFIRSIYSLYGKEDMTENVHLPDEGHDFGPNKRIAMYDFMSKHLSLNKQAICNAAGKYDENFVVPATPESLMIFPDRNYPVHTLKTVGEIYDRLRESQQ